MDVITYNFLELKIAKGPPCRPPNNIPYYNGSRPLYPRKECKHDIKKSEGNMFNAIFKENVQGQKNPGGCAFAGPEQLKLQKI